MDNDDHTKQRCSCDMISVTDLIKYSAEWAILNRMDFADRHTQVTPIAYQLEDEVRNVIRNPWVLIRNEIIESR